ncbi:hypothetical protein SAMN04487905_11555 [Actinopolyspora xinjiangensis]|uniref:Uncharacterized protein n=1 Tax=Actinopolyspora xinjiangensis TaxID=405564 RepID=A0A1H0WTE7_9ACTN|nr:hypothetical protein [Actinopolyspora xinjiangensis]SDP93902.1 hypothetical protein SAMN04487905_11555 [Actinopolyspora xinjiangensis]
MPIGVLVEIGATVFVVVTLVITCAVLLAARPPRSSRDATCRHRRSGRPLFPRGSSAG